MKAMCLEDSPAGCALVESDLPIPQPGPGELLIRVRAAGVTPSELSWYPTTHTKSGEARHRAVPGHEFSGVVAAVGEGAVSFGVGQDVYGWNDWFSDGATAEYCLAQAATIAPKPVSISHTEAASVPIGALTAWQGLLDRARLQGGETVLIHGGAGAVGIFAVQLARHTGARVVTTASARHTEFLQELGADRVLDYRTMPFEKRLREIDVVFDGVGGATLQRSRGILKPGGRLVTIASDGAEASDERTKAAFFIVEPNQAQLLEITELIDRGVIRPYVDAVVPLAEASTAYSRKTPRPTGRGKVVISVSDS